MTITSNTEQIQKDLAFAVRAARGAGERLLHLRALNRWHGDHLADVADHAADGFLQGMVQGAHPSDGLLSEETKDSPARRAKSRTWIIDPLDGTREYACMRHDWAVHVALTLDGRCAVAAVALPAVSKVLSAVCIPGQEQATLEEGDGTLVSGETPSPEVPRVAFTRSRTPPWVSAFCEKLGGVPVPFGSVGYKVALLLLGEADIYVHPRGLKEWDTCAPETIARALGWSVCDLDGEPHRYNQPDPENHEIIVCRPAWKERVLAALTSLRTPVG
ncbi:MAG: 3'(2'),5'-bisphosphate nucleotidase CysQ [Planctomycetota bacterium]